MIYYVISDGNGRYIRRDDEGYYVPTNSISLALKLTDRVKLQNIIRSSLNKNLRSRYGIMAVDSRQFENEPHTLDDIPITSRHNIDNDEDEAPEGERTKFCVHVRGNEDVAKRIGDAEIKDNELFSFSDTLDKFTNMVQDAEQRKEELANALSSVDMEITDINHYIELGKFNAYQGYLAFRMLQSRLIQRRKIKDEYQIIRKFCDTISSASLCDIKTSVERLNEREYTPRKLEELFE